METHFQNSHVILKYTIIVVIINDIEDMPALDGFAMPDLGLELFHYTVLCII